MNKSIALFLLVSGLGMAGTVATYGKDAKTSETVKKAGPLEIVLSDKMGGKSMAAFTATQAEIFLTYPADTLAKGDKVKAVWIIEDGGKTIDKNAKVSEFTNVADGAERKGFFHLTKPAAGWPVGTWRVEVSVNGVKNSSARFAIK